MNTEQNKEQGKPITPEEIRNEGLRMDEEMRQRSMEGEGIVKMHTAIQWMQVVMNSAAPRPLFRELWHEGEVCILFADTNTGKSILAVQIAEMLSAEHLVLYFDFEMSAKQFEGRYSNDYKDHYPFRENLRRLELDPDAEIPEGWIFEEYLNDCIERIIVKTGAKILIIDNLTYLRQEIEKAKDALPLMKELKALKNRHSLSILALAHTPKRDMTKPITRNDLQGSKMLMNFCDSAFSIGESASDNTLRYIKQIKARATELIYSNNNVIVARITKPDNFLCFEFIGYGNERDHLKQVVHEDRNEMHEQVLELYKQGQSLRQIGEQLGISHITVRNVVQKNKL